MGQTIYMVTTYWRGAMHVGTMRAFQTEDEAWNYEKTLSKCDTKVYALHSEYPPVLLKKKF